MGVEFSHVFDGSALAIVCAGTALATAARCGWRDLAATGRALSRLPRNGFDLEANRRALANCARAIERDGRLRADVQLPSDPAIARQVDRLLRTRPQEAIEQARLAEKSARMAERMRAVRTLEHAGELAPVFGLVGTLIAITQLAPATAAEPVGATMGAISTAVLSTLYGVLMAQFACIPLARAIERKEEAEEDQRDALLDWFMRCVVSSPPAQRAHMREVA
ncbi:MotA/TolQ/ExbB proton channel family protein [Erythrobacter sp. THAF29]|uniref:MotA/TolQ/ExbB proton channel family protein n=1 Tax=Erythrobacter sp. THAF29 TaxID=2587851 RepID=UPI0012A93E1C|nr:MotA/TolQ/ExbB proton channel family protein [Erythrobacter sp. THAF29]QFT76686.1 flagellar motor protein MotP [Erythrobacter sp. THAF29]